MRATPNKESVMKKVPPYVSTLMTHNPALQQTAAMFREDAAKLWGEAILLAPGWAAFLEGLSAQEIEQIKLEQGRMAHDLLTGAHLAMAQHAPETPWLEHLSKNRVREILQIPNLATISPALHQAAMRLMA